MRRILGIDPGSRVTGYGIIDSDGVRTTHITSGCINMAATDGLPERLGTIYREITALISIHHPVELAIEEVFLAKNAASALKLGQARGAAICAAVVAGLPVSEYTPRMIKQAVVGSGKAEKEQVQHMVRLILNMSSKMRSDQADALAVAISHAHSSATLRKLSGVTGGGHP